MMTEITLFEGVSAIRSGVFEIARFSQNLEKTVNIFKHFKELETWKRLRKEHENTRINTDEMRMT
jgi:hypothetical protein